MDGAHLGSGFRMTRESVAAAHLREPYDPFYPSNKRQGDVSTGITNATTGGPTNQEV